MTQEVSSGALLGAATFPSDVAGDANQSTLVAATPAAESEFGFAADAELPSGLLNPSAGAVCWESLDCVAWGSFAGSARSPAGQPAAPAGIPDGMALRRTIAPGCATLLEPSDDRDNSATDFSLVFPSPRPNSATPSERACFLPIAAGGNAHPEGGSPAADREQPQTRIRHQPGRRTRDRTPSFRFSSSVAGSTYLCRLDGRGFKRCHSPFTARRLGFGRHLFAVEARAPDGATDRSPAVYRFAVVKSSKAVPRNRRLSGR